MSGRHFVLSCVVAYFAIGAVAAYADPAPLTPVEELAEPMPTPRLRLLSGDGTLRGPNGKLYLIPRDSIIFTGPEWDGVDLGIKDRQDRITRLEAENKDLRASAGGWQPGALTLVLAFVAGTAGGVYLYSKL